MTILLFLKQNRIDRGLHAKHTIPSMNIVIRTYFISLSVSYTNHKWTTKLTSHG
jgi:hypothetical protein